MDNIVSSEEIRPTVKIEKSAGNVTYYQVFRWTDNWNNEWVLLKTTTNRAEAERYIGDCTKTDIEREKKHAHIKSDREKYILVSFDLPAKP